jgi:hypothetical protein
MYRQRERGESPFPGLMLAYTDRYYRRLSYCLLAIICYVLQWYPELDPFGVGSSPYVGFYVATVVVGLRVRSTSSYISCRIQRVTVTASRLYYLYIACTWMTKKGTQCRL